MGNCFISNINSPDTYSMEVSTQSKESHGLYDYESKEISVKYLQLQPGYFLRFGGQVLFQESNEINQNFQNLLHLEQRNDKLVILVDKPVNEQKQSSKNSVSQLTMGRSDEAEPKPIQSLKNLERGNKLWLVVSSMQVKSLLNGVPLIKGDIFKIGRIKMRVREINVLGDDAEISSWSDTSQIENSRNQICRVCLQEKVSSINPLINPCKCAGTMKYIHLQCLQTWLRQKLHLKQNDHCTIYLWKDLSCELCKFKYKPVFKSDGITFDLVELSKPKGIPFVLLELHSKSLQPHEIMDQGDTFSKKACGIYIITFGLKQEVKLGRGHENDVRVSDISVSRCHAKLNLIDNKLVLQDQKSKFGTLILLKNEIDLSSEINDIKLQIGRHVMLFKARTINKKIC